jgi:hypothetical protein
MVKAPRVQAAKIAQSSDRDMADGFIEPNFRTTAKTSKPRLVPQPQAGIRVPQEKRADRKRGSKNLA